MQPIFSQTATQLAVQIRNGVLSRSEVLQSFLERIAALEPRLQAWAATGSLEELKRQATQSEEFATKSARRLEGVPVGIKDILNTADFPTEMGSPIWRGFRPGNDARVIFNLKYEGAVIAGKTHTSEFAVHYSTNTRNPRELTRAPGTSSGGSAAAVAAGMAPVALGSQTGGSIIRPASYCGVYGYKPTFGLVPRTGVLKTADTLDTIGWFSRSIADSELLFDVCRVSGKNYPFADSKLDQAVTAPPRPRLGFYAGQHWEQANEDARLAIHSALDQLSNAGFEIVEIDIESGADIYQEHELIYCTALAYYFRSETSNSRTMISPVLSAMLDEGAKVAPSAYQAMLQRQAARITTYLQALPKDVDAIVCLSAGGQAPIGLDAPDLPDTCKIWTYLGMPSLSMPALFGKEALPIGLQVVARKYDDYLLLRIADCVARTLNVTCEVAEVPPSDD